MELISLQFLTLFAMAYVSGRTVADRLSRGRPLTFVAFVLIGPATLIWAGLFDGKDPATAVAVGAIQGLLLVLGTAVLGFARWRCRTLDAGRMPAPTADER